MMNLLTIILIFTAVLYSTAQLDPKCSVCQLSGHFVPAKGYNCYPTATTAVCTCPGGTRYVEGGACRLCTPTNPNVPSVCNKNDAKFRRCLESDDFGPAYACLCEDASGSYTTTDYNCDRAGIVTAPTTTTIPTPGPGSICQNGGAYVNGVCQCPSGFSGPVCGTQDTNALCERITCKNDGVCAIRNPNGPFEAVCLCRYGTWGDYCELNGTLGSCSLNFCANNGACVENVVGTTRHAYCKCQPGYNGVKCENNHFKCQSAGSFPDQTMFVQGKYFTCTPAAGGSFKIEQKSCAKGLRFNQNQNIPQCTY